MFTSKSLTLLLMLTFSFNVMAENDISEKSIVGHHCLGDDGDWCDWGDLDFDEEITLEDIDNIPDKALSRGDYARLFFEGVKYQVGKTKKHIAIASEKTREHIQEHKKKYIVGAASALAAAYIYYGLLKNGTDTTKGKK